jgi:hypothetical protein
MVSLYAKTTISNLVLVKSSTDKPEIPNKDYKLLLSKLNIKPDDLKLNK